MAEVQVIKKAVLSVKEVKLLVMGLCRLLHSFGP